MPNDCWSNITITANKTDLNDILNKELKEIPDWALKIRERGKEAVRLDLWSAWGPDFRLFEIVIEKYPSCWIKNLWSEEGGDAGIWIGTTRHGQKYIQEMSWVDMCLEEESHRFRKNSIEHHNETFKDNITDEDVEISTAPLPSPVKKVVIKKD